MAADGQTATPDDDDAGDWGPFGQPLFLDPSARALSRVGVVDVGSNSVRMVVFDGAARSRPISTTKRSCAAWARGWRRPGV